ncbi:hypothetical protein KC19_12G075500 [Ceratodon purpureus]|uniref:PGG domain-containing protein n=1 Tax=Ceratodon purpureus TaxID=3225 RepID=A0A8T0G6Y2_CERPU|nr:hypothetical protein KC19_12G075500 [Ceratodon purpureus]
MDHGVRESNMEMGLLRNEGTSEPHVDTRSEQGSMEETELSTSSNLLGMTRRSASLSAWGGSNRQQRTPGQAVTTQGSHSEIYGVTSRSYIRMRHKALIVQFNSYAVLLVLLAGAMSVAILQPPGSFDTDGHIRKGAQLYLFMASMSFLFAIMGLFAVMIVFLNLFRPEFNAPPRTDDTLDGSATSREVEIMEVIARGLVRVYYYLGAVVIFHKVLNMSRDML